MIKKKQFDKEDIPWVASQKIHGSNFSVHVSEEVVRYGRRTDFLSKQIPIKAENPGEYFTETFYDARNYISVIHSVLPQVFAELKKGFPDMLKFSIYGEYFGGNWPEGEQKLKPVQKGIYYTPKHEFMAFDIKITDKYTHWVDVSDIPKYLKDLIKSVPIYARGTFAEMFAIDTKIDSTVPELLGLEKQAKNIIEGMVLRPDKSLFFGNGSRVMLKKKNAEFD